MEILFNETFSFTRVGVEMPSITTYYSKNMHAGYSRNISTLLNRSGDLLRTLSNFLSLFLNWKKHLFVETIEIISFVVVSQSRTNQPDFLGRVCRSRRSWLAYWKYRKHAGTGCAKQLWRIWRWRFELPVNTNNESPFRSASMDYACGTRSLG